MKTKGLNLQNFVEKLEKIKKLTKEAKKAKKMIVNQRKTINRFQFNN